MNQDLIQQDTTQDSLAAGGNGGFNTTTGYATGSVCQFSSTYRASNKYMDIVCLYAAGEIFRVGPDGKKTTWYALSSGLSTNKSGDFSSVKVEPGTV